MLQIKSEIRNPKSEILSGRGGQNRTVATSSQDSDACVTPHPDEKSKVSCPMSKVCLTERDFGLWTLDVGLSFHADHLLDLSNDFNQIFLILHHCFDGFVSARNFIQDARVLATFNARGLLREIFTSEVTLRCSA